MATDNTMSSKTTVTVFCRHRSPNDHPDKHVVHTPLALLCQGNWVVVRIDRLYNWVSYRFTSLFMLQAVDVFSVRASKRHTPVVTETLTMAFRVIQCKLTISEKQTDFTAYSAEMAKVSRVSFILVQYECTMSHELIY